MDDNDDDVGDCERPIFWARVLWLILCSVCNVLSKQVMMVMVMVRDLIQVLDAC